MTRNVYAETAKRFYKLPCKVSDVKSLYPEKYLKVKRASLAYMYAGSSKKISEILNEQT